jgi:hypothetical protein
MFVKLTKSGPRSYVQLVEAYRDDVGRPKERTVAKLGRLDQMCDSVRSLHDGLSQLVGLETAQASCNGAAFESSLALGDIWALTRLWEPLGLHRLGMRFRR